MRFFLNAAAIAFAPSSAMALSTISPREIIYDENTETQSGERTVLFERLRKFFYAFVPPQVVAFQLKRLKPASAFHNEIRNRPRPICADVIEISCRVNKQ